MTQNYLQPQKRDFGDKRPVMYFAAVVVENEKRLQGSQLMPTPSSSPVLPFRYREL